MIYVPFTHKPCALFTFNTRSWPLCLLIQTFPLSTSNDWILLARRFDESTHLTALISQLAETRTLNSSQPHQKKKRVRGGFFSLTKRILSPYWVNGHAVECISSGFLLLFVSVWSFNARIPVPSTGRRAQRWEMRPWVGLKKKDWSCLKRSPFFFFFLNFPPSLSLFLSLSVCVSLSLSHTPASIFLAHFS